MIQIQIVKLKLKWKILKKIFKNNYKKKNFQEINKFLLNSWPLMRTKIKKKDCCSLAITMNVVHATSNTISDVAFIGHLVILKAYVHVSSNGIKCVWLNNSYNVRLLFFF